MLGGAGTSLLYTNVADAANKISGFKSPIHFLSIILACIRLRILMVILINSKNDR